jgi:hypothetical protein
LKVGDFLCDIILPMEIICRQGNPRKPGLPYQISEDVKVENGIFTSEQPSPCKGCKTKSKDSGRVLIRGGVELKNEEDWQKAEMGEPVETINIVVSCKPI